MEIKKNTLGKMRRQRVEVRLLTGERITHDVCDIVMPSPDGRYFLIRDLTGSDTASDKVKPGSVDYFYPTTTVERVVVRSRQFYINPDGSRGEEVLDNEPEKGQIIIQEEKR